MTWHSTPASTIQQLSSDDTSPESGQEAEHFSDWLSTLLLPLPCRGWVSPTQFSWLFHKGEGRNAVCGGGGSHGAQNTRTHEMASLLFVPNPLFFSFFNNASRGIFLKQKPVYNTPCLNPLVYLLRHTHTHSSPD